MLTNQNTIIRENATKFRKRLCPQHQVSHVQKICTHTSCIKSISSSFLCNKCYRKHPENHNGWIPCFLEFDKIFSENIFNDIDLLENQCLNSLQEKKQRLDAEVDKYCDMIFEEIKQLIESMKFRIKLKYDSNELIETVAKLKESLKIEYNTLFSIDEANIKDKDIKQYLEFYLNFEKIFEQNQAKSEEIWQSLEEESHRISQLFNRL